MEKKQKVLCVDDEPINLLIMGKNLGKTYEVITAEGGKKALEILENDPEIFLVISDMHMPLIDGLEFIQEAQQRFSNKKFFILTGYAITREIQKALDSHLICDYFQKPPNYQKIEEALKEYI